MSVEATTVPALQFTGYADDVAAVWAGSRHLGFVQLTGLGWLAYGTHGERVGRRRTTRARAARQLASRRRVRVPQPRHPADGTSDAPLRLSRSAVRRSLLARRG